MTRGMSYVNFIADRNETAILQNQISRLNVDYLDGIQGVHAVRIVKPRVLDDGRLMGDILAPMGRGTAMATQEKWQKESLGEVKLVRDAQGKETYVVESSEPVFLEKLRCTGDTQHLISPAFLRKPQAPFYQFFCNCLP